MMTDQHTYPELVGTPSDQAPAILATGRSDITTLFVSFSERHPEGADAEYLRWHSLDHRPEQHRLASIRASLRLVSTPACRAARAASDPSLDATDHLMTYFFTGVEGLGEFTDLSDALRDAGRCPFILKPVTRGVFAVNNRTAAPHAKAGADVLPWRPVTGAYVLVERGELPADDLITVPGVAGIWSAHAEASAFSTLAQGHQISYLFLDDDPIATAERLKPVLEKRWQDTGTAALLAAPFYAIVPFEWDRYLP